MTGVAQEDRGCYEALARDVPDVVREQMREGKGQRRTQVHRRGLCKRDITMVLRPDRFLVTKLDKMRWGLRWACPRLGVLEVLRDSRAYYELTAETTDDQQKSWQAWCEMAKKVLTDMVPGGFAVPTQFRRAGARSLPKGKAPQEKGRLLVAHCGSSLATVQRYAAKAAEPEIVSTRGARRC